MASTIENTVATRGNKCIWRPFTQEKGALQAIELLKAEGAYLYDREGRRYFDGISSWWVNTHGHAHPHIAKRIATQAEQLDHAVFADFTHKPAVELAERLLKLHRRPTGRVFFADSGSTTIEAAIKMAFQYWHQNPSSIPRKKVICFENAYHGDTFGAMSVAGKTHYNRPFWPYMFEVETIPTPSKGREDLALKKMQRLLAEGNVAFFIFEPIVQGAAGMLMHTAEGLDALLHLCKKHEVIAIADEVMTGFGRTGPLFACDPLTNKPDITCLSKGLTGGFLPSGVTICSEEIYKGFYSDRSEDAFLHGATYCANPIVCAAALGSLDLFEKPQCEWQRQMIADEHMKFRILVENHPRVKRCEVAGTILVVEYNDGKRDNEAYFSSLKDRLKAYFFQRNIYVRPLGNILYVLPPYCTSKEDLQSIYGHILASLEEVS